VRVQVRLIYKEIAATKNSKEREKRVEGLGVNVRLIEEKKKNH
jgi:hypothetical protein